MTDPLMFALVSFVLSAMVLFVFFAMPISAYLHFRLPTRPMLEPVRQLADLPEEADTFFRHTAKCLATDGFRDRIDAWRGEFFPGQPMLLCLLENVIAGDCLVMLWRQPDSQEDLPAKRHQCLEFRTWYADGHRITTRNRIGNPLGGFWPESHVLELPAIIDASELYRDHMAMLDRFGGIAKKEELANASPRGLVTREWERELRAGVASGYLRPVQNGAVYRYTWYGAFASTWQDLWPFDTLRRSIQKLHSDRLMQGLRGS